MKSTLWIPVAYMAVFGVLLLIAWPHLDATGTVGVVSVLGGGLAGVVGAFAGAVVALRRVEKESQTKIKEFAASQALELTKLEIDLRLKEGRQHRLLAAAKIYREFYKALFELYDTKAWPKEIEQQRLINSYDFGGGRPSDAKGEDEEATQ
jgi:hypothetical protein